MKYYFLILFLLFGMHLCGQNQFTNPIIAGSYPDPSICRVGDEYFIVNSSFEYFPGLPVHRSRDLVNWELAGYGLHRAQQVTGAVNLVDVNSNGGIHAPTIRHNNGLFHIITTNVYYNEQTQLTDFVNFIVTAENIEGPWSMPYVIEGAPGIDPDLFFDDDGRVWYVGNHAPENPNFEGEGEIWLQELDAATWTLIGERHFLWRGACGGVWAEGPHMYKRDGRYYLLIAEGGTGFNHAVMIAVAEDITGPYISNERNPILTSRHLSYNNWVHSTGHADLIELPDGRWYMVALGVRGEENRGSNMGRESHLMPVVWEREPWGPRYEWPVVAPETGRVERYNPLPFEGTKQLRNDAFTDNFDSDQLDLEWNFRRLPMDNTYSLTASRGSLRLFAHPNVIRERGRASLMGFRQKESDFEYQAKMNFSPRGNGLEAGISLFRKDDNYITFTVVMQGRGHVLQIRHALPDHEPQVINTTPLENYRGEIILRLNSADFTYSFSYSTDGGKTFNQAGEMSAAGIVSRGYTGTYMGVYATSNGNATREFADFDWVSYKGFQRK